MNLSDVVVVVLILIFAFLGLKTGLFMSIFKIGSFLISIWISIKFYPKVADLLMKTKLFDSIKNGIFNSFLEHKESLLAGVDEQINQISAETAVENLPLPGFLKDNIAKNMPSLGNIIDVNNIIESISTELSKIVIYIISMILLFIVIRIILLILKHFIKGIAKLPVLKQFDKLGGFIFGVAEGVLVVYIVLAILTIFNAVPSFKQVYDSIAASKIAKIFYENNFILNLMF